MRRVSPFAVIRTVAVAIILLLMPYAVSAAMAAIKVNCNVAGQTITAALGANVDVSPLVLQVKGTCTENVTITRDDVTIKTNGVAHATIHAADPAKATVLLDGARRIVIDGKVANGISVTGGTFNIDATRGSSLNVSNCAVSGASNQGIISAFNSTVAVDACSITGNANGVIAANSASMGITNSTVSGNTGTGLVATRTSYLRVGQDLSGNPIAKPVTVSGNGSTGISITEGSSGTIVGGTVETSGGTGIFVGRASSGQIGLGSNGLTGGPTVKNGSSNGISIEGGNATIVFSTITGNLARGIVLSNSGGARIGITNSNGVFGANTISGNGSDGIGLFYSAAALIGGNTIDENVGFGITVGQASVNLVGGNTITNNGLTGVAVRGGQALIGDPGFGAPSSVNTISGNGTVPGGPANGGLFAFEGGNMLVNGAIIANNIGAAVQAFEAGVFELRGSTAVTVPATGSTPGATILFGSTLRVRDSASIISATSDGIQASNLASVNIRDNTSVVQGNGVGGHGVSCFNTGPLTVSAAILTGNFSGVSGTAGPSAGCNVFP